jgi:hypothetical protein
LFVVLERSQAALEQAAAQGGYAPLLEGVLACAPQLQEVPEVFARARADAVAVDCMMVAALSACERARLPTAVIVHSAPGALFGPDSIHAQAVPGPLNALRATLGLGPIERLWDNWRGMTVLCTSIRALDPMGEELPPAFDYVGPVAERVPPSGWYAPWPRDDARPLVLVSFSTMPFQDPAGSRIRRTLAGLAGRPWRVLVTTSSADVSGLAAPENAVVLRHVPHGEVLPGAAATVTHGGHGTVAASLAHGVPLVCLPGPRGGDRPHVGRMGVLPMRWSGRAPGPRPTGQRAPPCASRTVARFVSVDPLQNHFRGGELCWQPALGGGVLLVRTWSAWAAGGPSLVAGNHYPDLAGAEPGAARWSAPGGHGAH